MKTEIAIKWCTLFLNCLCHHNRESGCLKSFENIPSKIMQTFFQLGILHHNLNIPFLPRRFYFNQYYVSLNKNELIVHTLRQPGTQRLINYLASVTPFCLKAGLLFSLITKTIKGTSICKYWLSDVNNSGKSGQTISMIS